MLKQFTRIAGIGVCALMLLGANQCQTSTTNGIGSDGPVFVTSVSVEDANGNVASTFPLGASIQFVLSIRNRSSTSQTLAFNTGQQYNFEVVQNGTANEVWTWSVNQPPFSQNSSSLSFQPDETKTFSYTWSQVNDSLQPVASGDYEVIGGITCNNSSSSSSSSSSNSTSATDCMPTGILNSDQLVPSVYVSTLVPFTIQ